MEEINKLSKININLEKNIEEIRIRINLPIMIKIQNEEIVLNHISTREEIDYILQKICENSIYSYQNQIAEGYITINGGHRVGIVGKAVVKDEKVINLNYISGLNFRISKQIIDCSNDVIKYILDWTSNNIFNTLIISPPRFR